MADQIPQGRTQITASELAAKFQSKREIWKFLSLEVKAYLDNYEAKAFRMRDSQRKVADPFEDGRPKYGRRRAYHLFASDFDLLKV